MAASLAAATLVAYAATDWPGLVAVAIWLGAAVALEWQRWTLAQTDHQRHHPAAKPNASRDRWPDTGGADDSLKTDL